jgi:hypothetical protein
VRKERAAVTATFGALGPPRRLTFFCELAEGPLQALFSGASVLKALGALGAGVSLAVLDLTGARARVVRQLMEAGVPVTAWLLLPRSEGYFFHLGNAGHAAARYAAFQHWTAQHGLQWAGVGMDFEPDLSELERVMRSPLQGVLPLLARTSTRRASCADGVPTASWWHGCGRMATGWRAISCRSWEMSGVRAPRCCSAPRG